MISVVIPAYNEEERIRGVISAAKSHPLVSEVIVVNDGSTDATAAAARAASAKVIDLPGNGGKGPAMDAGVAAAQEDIIVFLDADLTGLTLEVLTTLIEPVAAGRADMAVLVRDHWSEALNYWPRIALGGERALHKSLWYLVPEEERRGFRVELALNFHALNAGKNILTLRARGLRQTFKVQKYGLMKGIRRDLSTFRDCAGALADYYVVRRFPSSRASK